MFFQLFRKTQTFTWKARKRGWSSDSTYQKKFFDTFYHKENKVIAIDKQHQSSLVLNNDSWESEITLKRCITEKSNVFRDVKEIAMVARDRKWWQWRQILRVTTDVQ